MASARACERKRGGPSSAGAAGKDESACRPEATDRRFPKSVRLRSRREFQTVYRKGRRVVSPSFVFFGMPSTRAECRLGITVTRKIGRAAVRNRIKRVVREIFRKNRSRLHPSTDLVVNARAGSVGRATVDLEREFLGCFARLHRKGRARR